MSLPKRCQWCGDDPQYQAYHDEEWGVPNRQSQTLFEMLCLEGAQAGLSWITVLRKRDHYRTVFDQFDPYKIAQYDEQKRAELLADPGIIRNKLKVNAFIVNAQKYIDIQTQAKESGELSFSDFLWQFVEGRPIVNQWHSASQVPVNTPQSDQMSAALKKRGFKFVGSTICYAFMQACGMVNDHTLDCYRHKQV